MLRSRSHPASPSQPPFSMISHKRGSHFLAAPSHVDSDVDVARRGKRRRRDNLSTVDIEKCPVLSTCENQLQGNHESSFATTSAQFNLCSRPSNSGGKGRRNPTSDLKVSHERQHGYVPDLARLRSSAFWELRQSISENGEGLVRRMRDYENLRTKHPTHQKAKEAGKRERKKLHFPKKKVYVDASDASDEEDVLISSGESTNHILRGTFLRNVKDPIDVMDVDSDWPSAPHSQHTRTRGSFAAQDTQYTNNSTATDDESSIPVMGSETEEIIQQSPVGLLQSPTPSLSHSTGESPCSSFVSLPRSSSVISDDDFFYPSILSGPSSTSEKAIAALNLAMANGAGSINDYSVVNNLEEIILVENYDHGDLWN